MASTPKMISYYNADLHLSIRVPDSWAGEIIDESKFRLFSPPEPQFANYRSTLSFQLGQPEGHGQAWVEDLFAQSAEEMRKSQPGFRIINEERFVLSSLAPVYLRHYHWQDDETALAFAQLQALILYNDQMLYVAHSATLQQLEAKYIPVQLTIIRSTRIIDPSPGG